IVLQKKGTLNSEEEVGLENVSVETRPPPLAEVTKELPRGFVYKPLSTPWRLALVLFVIVALGAELFYGFAVVGQTQLKSTRTLAIKNATAYMKLHGVDLEGMRSAGSLSKGILDEEMQYLFENVKLARTQELAQQPERPLLWSVRFFKPLQVDEYLVILDQNATPMSLGLVKPETAQGESPSQAEAQQRVEQFLTMEHPELSGHELDDVSQTNREHRKDYSFQYQVPQYRVADAKYIASVDCIGGVVSGYDHVWQLPDKWKFERAKTSIREQVCLYTGYAVGLICLVAMLIWARGVLRARAIPWRPAITIGIASGVIYMLKNLNDLPEFFIDYETKDPLITFYIAQAVGQIVGAFSTFAIMAVVAAFGLASLRLLLPNTSLSAILKTTFSPAPGVETASHRQLWIDAVLVGYAVGIGDCVLTLAFGSIKALISPAVLVASSLDGIAADANVFDPAIAAMSDSIMRGFYIVFITAILVGLYAKFLHRFRNYVLFGVVTSLLGVSYYKYWQDAAIDFASYMIAFVASWFIVTRIARENILAYFLAGIAGLIAPALRLLLRYCGGVFEDDCVALAVFLLAPALYALLRAVGPEGKTQTIEPS
ncbi:MAG: hypothetical protein ACRD3W_07805, partial [Terriglobales bacterium]